jgi:hypothetical protein
MAGNLDLNVVISASFEKLKKGMADAVNVVKGGSKKMEQAAEGSKQALEKALGGENLRVKRRELTQTINEQRSILTSFKQDLINLENKLAQTSKGDLMRQKALKNAIAGLKVEIKDQEQAVRQLSEARTEANFSLEEGSRRAEQNTQAMEALSRAVNAGAMATLLLAGDNKGLSKVMRGVQVTMALASAAVAVYNLTQRQNEVFTLASSKAQAIYAAAVGTSTGAMKAFRVALLASGVGLAIGLVAMLASHFIDLADSTSQAADATERWDQSLRDSVVSQEAEKRLAAMEAEGKSQREIMLQKIEDAKETEKLYRQDAARLTQGTKEYLEAQKKISEAETKVSVLKSELTKLDNEENAKNIADKLKRYQDYVKEVTKLERSMYEELAKLQIGYTEWANKYFERKAPPEITISTFAPASVTEPGVKAPDVLPGVGSFMDMATQNQEAANVDLDAIEQFRKNTYQYGLILGMRARQTESFADKMTIAAEQATLALNSMAADMASAFGTMMGETIAGKADAFTTFMQAFANSMANFLNTFGKALIAQAIAIDAFKESLKSLNPAIALAAGIGLLAASALVKSTMAKGENVTAFADGGIVSGPTLGLMGEYPGARTNPEVIAPLDKLQSMINTGQGGNFVAQTKFDGRDLWLAVNRYEKDKARG